MASGKVGGSGASGASGTAGAIRAIGDDRPVFRIDFANEEEFLRIFRRDIANGGLFVATATPADLDQHVIIELAFSEPELAPVRLPARVVHCFAPEDGAPRNLLSGMGVEFLDPRSALASLRPVLARYRV